MSKASYLFFSLIFVVLTFSNAIAQQSDLSYLIEKIKNNYPGYREKTEEENFNKYVTNVIANNKRDTFKIMSKVVDFFHDRHLDLFKEPEAIDSIKCAHNLQKVRSYFRSTKQLKQYEGFWISEANHLVIALLRTSEKPIAYKGFIIESRDSSTILPGLVYYDFEQINNKEFYTRATSSASRLTFYIHSFFRSDSVMTAGPYNKWKKINYQQPILSTLSTPVDFTIGKWLNSKNFGKLVDCSFDLMSLDFCSFLYSFMKLV